MLFKELADFADPFLPKYGDFFTIAPIIYLLCQLQSGILHRLII